MTCPSCGGEIASARPMFCPHCGAPLSPAAWAPAPRRAAVEVLKLLLLAGAFAAVGYWFGRVRQVLAFVGVFTLLLVVYNVIYVVVGRAMGLRAEVFSIYFGPTLARFRGRQMTYEVGWLPLGGYVKFPRDDPTSPHDPAPYGVPPSRRFDDVHPLGRALLAISAPLVILAIALAVLGPRGIVESAQALAHHLPGGPISTIRAFVDRFSTAAGSVRAGGQLALALAAINLLPIPIVSGGMALTYVLQWVTGKAKSHSQNRP